MRIPLSGKKIGAYDGPIPLLTKGHLVDVTLSHPPGDLGAFDDPNLVAAAGLVPLVKFAQTAVLTKLAADRFTVPTDKGANAGMKVTSLVAGMAAGADSFDDLAVLRHGGMGRVFTRAYARCHGQFLRAFTFGHVRQLDGSPPGSCSSWPA